MSDVPDPEAPSQPKDEFDAVERLRQVDAWIRGRSTACTADVARQAPDARPSFLRTVAREAVVMHTCLFVGGITDLDEARALLREVVLALFEQDVPKIVRNAVRLVANEPADAEHAHSASRLVH